jgi:hypothetical protein
VEPTQLALFASKGLKYSTVLELDRKIRSHPIPDLLQYRSMADSQPEVTAANILGLFAVCYQDASTFTHRNIDSVYSERWF